MSQTSRFASLMTFTLLVTTSLHSQAMIGGTPIRSGVEVFLENCTGTMIAQDVILVAGHCAFLNNEYGKLSYTYQVGEDIMINSYDGSDYALAKRAFITKVKSIQAYPAWEGELRKMKNPSADTVADLPNVSDVGVIVLQDRLPLKTALLPDLINPQTNAETNYLMIHGAGCQQRGLDATMGTLKAAFVPIQKTEQRRVLVGINDAITKTNVGVCKRDSGGGAFYLTKDTELFDLPVVMAVNSVMAGTDEQALSSDPVPAYLSRIDQKDVLNWLRSFLAGARSSTTAQNVEHQSLREDIESYQGKGEITFPPSLVRLIQSFQRDTSFTCLGAQEVKGLVQAFLKTPKSVPYDQAIAAVQELRSRACSN